MTSALRRIQAFHGKRVQLRKGAEVGSAQAEGRQEGGVFSRKGTCRRQRGEVEIRGSSEKGHQLTEPIKKKRRGREEQPLKLRKEQKF